MPQVRLPRLQGRDLPFGARCVYCGTSGDGKTNTLLDVLYQNRHDDDAMLQSGCAEGGDADRELAAHFPLVYVTDTALHGVNWDRLKRVLRRCIHRSGKIEKLNRVRRLQQWRPLRQARTHIILEDCTFDKSVRNNEALRYLFQVGRRYVRALHVTLQRITGLHPDSRRQCSYIFMMYTAVPAARREMYEEYIGKNKELTFEQFCGIMDGIQKYQALVFMPQLAVASIWERFAYYSAPLRSQTWKFGRRAYWRAHRAWFDRGYFKREMETALGDGASGSGRKSSGGRRTGTTTAGSQPPKPGSPEARVTVTLADNTPPAQNSRSRSSRHHSNGRRQPRGLTAAQVAGLRLSHAVAVPGGRHHGGGGHRRHRGGGGW